MIGSFGWSVSGKLLGIDLGLLRTAVTRAVNRILVDQGVQSVDDVVIETDRIGIQVFLHMLN